MGSPRRAMQPDCLPPPCRNGAGRPCTAPTIRSERRGRRRFGFDAEDVENGGSRVTAQALLRKRATRLAPLLLQFPLFRFFPFFCAPSPASAVKPEARRPPTPRRNPKLLTLSNHTPSPARTRDLSGRGSGGVPPFNPQSEIVYFPMGTRTMLRNCLCEPSAWRQILPGTSSQSVAVFWTRLLTLMTRRPPSRVMQ